MNYNDNGTIKQITVKAGDTLPVGTEVDFDGTTIPAGWEEVPTVGENTKTVYKARMSSGQSDTYTIEEEGMYLVIAHTNGDNRCIMDVIIYVNRTINATRIKDETNPYKSITYSGNVVTMNNTLYTGMYSIIKLY